MGKRLLLSSAIAALLLAGGACSSGDDSSTEATGTTASVSPSDVGAQIDALCEAVDTFVADAEAAGDDLADADREALINRYQDLQRQNRDLSATALAPDDAAQLDDCSSSAAQAYAAIPSE